MIDRLYNNIQRQARCCADGDGDDDNNAADGGGHVSREICLTFASGCYIKLFHILPFDMMCVRQLCVCMRLTRIIFFCFCFFRFFFFYRFLLARIFPLNHDVFDIWLLITNSVFFCLFSCVEEANCDESEITQQPPEVITCEQTSIQSLKSKLSKSNPRNFSPNFQAELRQSATLIHRVRTMPMPTITLTVCVD